MTVSPETARLLRRTLIPLAVVVLLIALATLIVRLRCEAVTGLLEPGGCVLINSILLEFLVIVPSTLAAIFLWITGYFWWRARRISRTGKPRSDVEIPAVLTAVAVTAYVLVIAGCGAIATAVPTP
jgi:hypothetical protein